MNVSAVKFSEKRCYRVIEAQRSTRLELLASQQAPAVRCVWSAYQLRAPFAVRRSSGSDRADGYCKHSGANSMDSIRQGAWSAATASKVGRQV